MAKHKAATEVAIAKTEDETDFSEFVKTYGKPVSLIAVVISAAILFNSWRKDQAETAALGAWEELGLEVALDGSGFFSQGIGDVSMVAMEEFSSAHANDAAGAWAKALEVGEALREGDSEAANRALGELQSTWPDHILNTNKLFVDTQDKEKGAQRLADLVSSRLSTLDQWKADNKAIFEPLPMPEDAPRIRFNTSAGSFVIALRSSVAPQHCSNFLKLCGEGFYDNILFHEIEGGKLIKSGSQASRDANLSEQWGKDDHGGSIKPEMASVWNFRYAVGASHSIDFPSESSDCRFYIVTGDDTHDRDRDFTVFGMVVDGMETIKAIDEGSVLGTTPQEPVSIQSTEVL